MIALKCLQHKLPQIFKCCIHYQNMQLCHYFNSFPLNRIQLKMCSMLWKRLTPFSPFFNLSSMKSDRYSGDRELRLRKYSKSPAIVCLKSRSLLKDSKRKRSKRDLRSSKPCRQGRKNKRSSRFTKLLQHLVLSETSDCSKMKFKTFWKTNLLLPWNMLFWQRHIPYSAQRSVV